jgi:hypothetical protein
MIEGLAERLLRDADGSWTVEAATRLLILHGSWLVDPDFSQFICSGEIEGREWVGIDWRTLGRALEEGTIVGSQPDISVLEIAASIIGAREIRLRDHMMNHTRRTMEAIAVCLMHAGGHTESSATAA